MEKNKKPFILSRFTPFMESKKILLPISLILSGISALLNILPFIFIWFIVKAVFNGDHSQISSYAWYAFASAIAAVIMYFLSLMSSHLAAFHVEISMQKIGLQRVMNKPLGFFDQYPSGQIRKIINDGASATHGFLAHQLPDLAGSVISPIALLALFFVFDWRMGIASLIPIIIGMVIMSSLTSSQGKKFQTSYLDTLEEMSSQSVEYVRGIPVVKTFGQSIFSFEKFHRSIINYRDMVSKFTMIWRVPYTIYAVLMQAAPLFLVPAAMLLIRHGNTVPEVIIDYIFYLCLTPIFSTVFMKIQYFRHNFMIAEQAIDRFDNLLSYPDIEQSTTPANIKQSDITFKNVSFHYHGTEDDVLHDISFHVKEGETVALVGGSGGGKTTIARLAARFWDTQQGEILVGGVNVRDIPKEQLMERVSFVFQNTKLFKGSLRENILFGNESASEQELSYAIKASQSEEFINQYAQGLDTVIGSEGTYLSGGEQQRIALARAMLKNAPIILLDEATAFADPENEHLIHQALRELSKGKTTLMIAHRLTSVVDVDKILVIEKGHIVEEGTHAALLEKGGKYATMWQEYQQSADWKIAN